MKRNKLSKPDVKAIGYICDVYLKCISNEKFSLDKVARIHHIDATWATQLSGKYVQSKGHRSMIWVWVGGPLSYQLIEKIIKEKIDAKADYKIKYNKKIELLEKDDKLEIDAKTIELDFDKREPVKENEVSADEFNMFKQLAKKLFGI